MAIKKNFLDQFDNKKTPIETPVVILWKTIVSSSLDRNEIRHISYISACLQNDIKKITFFFESIKHYSDLIKAKFNIHNSSIIPSIFCTKEILDWVMENYRPGLLAIESSLNFREEITEKLEQCSNKKIEDTNINNSITMTYNNFRIETGNFTEDERTHLISLADFIDINTDKTIKHEEMRRLTKNDITSCHIPRRYISSFPFSYKLSPTSAVQLDIIKKYLLSISTNIKNGQGVVLFSHPHSSSGKSSLGTSLIKTAIIYGYSCNVVDFSLLQDLDAQSIVMPHVLFIDNVSWLDKSKTLEYTLSKRYDAVKVTILALQDCKPTDLSNKVMTIIHNSFTMLNMHGLELV